MARKYHNRALVNAVVSDDLAAVKRELEQGADPNALVSYDDSEERQPVWRRLWLLLAAKTKPHDNSDARTALQAAFECRPIQGVSHIVRIPTENAPIVSDLLIHGANPNVRDANGKTTLMQATEFSNVESAKYLLQYGADPNIVSRESTPGTALCYAATNDDPRIIRLLFRSEADPNLNDSAGAPPIIYAAEWGRTGAIKDLVACGADPNAVDSEGSSALMKAAENGHVQAAKTLIALGANPGAKDKRGLTTAERIRAAEKEDELTATSTRSSRSAILQLLPRTHAATPVPATAGTRPKAP